MIAFITLTTVAHIASGTIAVSMGAVALTVQKGARLHIKSGRMFALCMGLSSLLGALLGLIRFETFYITFHAGVLGVTLVLSSWLLAKGRLAHRSAPFMLVAGVNLLNTVGLVVAGFCALTMPDQTLRTFAAADYFFLSGMAGVALINDLIVFLRKHLSDRHRIAQHLWRMCLGFFIAAGSAFTGPGAGIFPQAVQDSGLLALPELTIILLMLFWLVRTVYGKGRKPILSQT